MRFIKNCGKILDINLLQKVITSMFRLDDERKPSIEGLGVFGTPKHVDYRGYFTENWRKHDLLEFGVPESFFEGKLQNNVSVSTAGTIRGVHCQGYPKFMTVAQGIFRMVFLDLRLGSETYKAIEVIDVTPGMSIFVPAGVANGAQSLEDASILNYLVTDYYDPNKDYLSITPLDKDLNLPWSKSEPYLISEKDSNARTYKEVLEIIETEKIKVALIGSTGSVGSVLKTELDKDLTLRVSYFNRDNLQDLTKQDYDVVICTAPSSEKLLTNLGFKNSEEEVSSLLSAIEQVETKYFILVSTKSIFESGSRYSEIHQKVYSSVVRAHKNFTVYVLDTLYGNTLKKGFISDLLTKQWSYLKSDVIEKELHLKEFYEPLTETLWKRVEDVPKSLFERLPSIQSLYSDTMCYQTTSIPSLVEEVKGYLTVPRGVLFGVKTSKVYTGQEIFSLLHSPDDSDLGSYFYSHKLNK